MIVGKKKKLIGFDW